MKKVLCQPFAVIGLPGLALLAALAAPLAASDTPARALTPPAVPTDVFVGVFDVEVFEIDERRQTFLIEADLLAEWNDPRLAFDPSAGLTPDPAMPLVFEQEAAFDLLKTIWWPNFEVVDGRGSRNRMHLSIQVFPDGTVAYFERFSAEIKQDLDLRRFPFDGQDISFALGPFSAGGGQVVFLPLDVDRQPIAWQPSEWLVYDPQLVVLPGRVCSGSGEPCLDGSHCSAEETCDLGWASVQVRMSISRVPKYYVWKIILPLALIVLVSSAVFWLDLERFPDPGDRLAISFTGVLTIVAFDFVSSESLPRLWYTTALDRILVMAYVFLAINIALNVVATQLSKSRPAAYARVDRIGRYGFPAAFVVGLLIALL